MAPSTSPAPKKFKYVGVKPFENKKKNAFIPCPAPTPRMPAYPSYSYTAPVMCRPAPAPAPCRTWPPAYTAGATTSFVGDINRDGIPDRVDVTLGQPAPAPVSYNTCLPGYNAGATTSFVGDINRDGIPDRVDVTLGQPLGAPVQQWAPPVTYAPDYAAAATTSFVGGQPDHVVYQPQPVATNGLVTHAAREALGAMASVPAAAQGGVRLPVPVGPPVQPQDRARQVTFNLEQPTSMAEWESIVDDVVAKAEEAAMARVRAFVASPASVTVSQPRPVVAAAEQPADTTTVVPGVVTQLDRLDLAEAAATAMGAAGAPATEVEAGCTAGGTTQVTVVKPTPAGPPAGVEQAAGMAGAQQVYQAAGMAGTEQVYQAAGMAGAQQLYQA